MAKRVYKDTAQNRKLGRVGKEIPSKAKAPAKVVKKRIKDDDSIYDVEGRKDRSRVKSTKYVDEKDDSSNPMKKKKTHVMPSGVVHTGATHTKSSKPVAKAKPKKKVSTTPPAKKEEKKATPPLSKIKGVSAGTMEAYRKAKAKRAAREAAKSKATPPKKIAENGKRGDAKYNEEYSKQLMKKRALQKEVKTKVPKYLALKKKLGGGARVDKDGKPVPAPRKAKTAPVPAPRKKKEKPVPKPRPKPKPPSYKEITKPKAKAKAKAKPKAKAKAKVMKPDTPAQAAKFANAILGPEDSRSETLDQQIERKFAEHKIQKKNQNQKPKAKGVQALLADKSSYIPPKVAKTTALANPPSKLEPPKKAKKAGRKSLRKSRSNLKKKLKKKGMKIKIGVPKDKGSTPEVVKSSEEKSDVEKSLGELHGFGNVQSLADLFQGLSHIEPNLVNKIADSVDTEERQNGLTFDEYFDEEDDARQNYWGEYIDDASYSGRYAETDDEMEAISAEATNYAREQMKDDWRKEGAIAKNDDAIAKTPALTERKGKKRAVKSTELKGVGGKGGGLPLIKKEEKKVPPPPALTDRKGKKRAVKTTELKGVGGKGGGVPPILKKTTPSRVKKAKGIAEKPKELSATELFYKGDDAGAKAKRLKDASAFNKLYGGNTAKAKQTADEETAYFSKLFPNPNYKPPPPKPRPGKARNLDYGKLKVSHLKLLNDAEKAKFRKLIVKKMDNDESLTKAEAKEWKDWLKTQGGFK